MLPVQSNPSSLFSVLFSTSLLWPSRITLLSLNFLENDGELPLCSELLLCSHECRRHCSSIFSADVTCSDGHLLYMLCHMRKYLKNTKGWNKISSIHSLMSEASKCRKTLLYVILVLQED